ncbi:MAG: histidinol dehydrogenase [Ostreibacterium sp.]
MNIQTVKYQEKNQQIIKDLVAWTPSFDAQIGETVANIIHQMRKLGDVALLDYTRQFDRYDVKNASELRVPYERLVNAWESISDAERDALQLAKQRITAYAQKQKLEDWQIEEADGSIMGQKITALDSVGLYVPGGTAAYPSSVLMNAIPAKVAGVKRIVMVSPATQGQLNNLVLAATFLCEIDEFYTIGGAQAVAALAYGTKTIEPVDKIVGPGNIYVATAKKQVFGKVAIDMIAGPSEIVIISDGSANAEWVAADLFSQAEHDPNAQSILITHSQSHADDVIVAMDEMIVKMPRKEIIEQSIATRGAVILTESVKQSVEVAQLIAPEHLEILTKEAMEVAQTVTHAGAIFIGSHSCEVLGDYIAGPNHVLPTSGTARFSSPLGVYDFQKRSSLIYCTPAKASELAIHARFLARSEGLHAHALSAAYRIQTDIIDKAED